MKAVLVFIDGTICDTRHRNPLFGTEAFFLPENILADSPTPGSVQFLKELSARYRLVYIGARPKRLTELTQTWLMRAGFPQGGVFLGENQTERLTLVTSLKNRFDFAAGIGDRWDDNELHLALGCTSFILKEWEPSWDTVRKYLFASD